MKYISKFIALFIVLLLCSCNDTTENDINKITFLVTTDDEVEFFVGSVDGMHLNATAKGSWEYTITTEKSYTGIDISCESEDAIVTITIYKNGETITSKQGKRFIRIPYIALK